MAQEWLATVLDRQRRRTVMISRRMIGAAALSLLVATPVTATAQGRQHGTGYSRQMSPIHATPGFTSKSVFGAYALDKSGSSVQNNTTDDFQRRNTFN
jgi:hypothetical protein